uniref:ZZ-type domain-containing protein n=1 Tax=Bionectria ochroleuca TaxID=29856 RepID=A0A8H7TT20_BIOOC
METAGLVIGVVGLAGLFNSCLEALDKLQTYRTFGNDSHILDTRFSATKARFERWGPGVGIERGQLMHAHHPALDDKDLSDTVAKLLHVIVEAICNPGNVASHRARGVGFDSDGSLEGDRHTLRRDIRNPGPATSQSGAPSTGNDPWSVPKRDVPSTNTLTKGADLIHGWSDEMRRILKRIEENARAETRRQVHAWLSSCPPDERYHDSLHKRLPGTCKWILDRTVFIRWLAESVSPKLLWVNGHAGFGKTILCAHLADHLASTLGAPAAHFFFSSDHASREDPFLALRSWVSQIISQNDDAFEHAWQSWLSDADLLANRVTVMNLFKQVVHDIPGCTLIADGLDEFLFVSRDEPGIRDVLMNDAHATFDEYRIMPEDVRPDTNAYAHAIVNRKLSNKSDNVRSTLSEAMSDRCQGQFLWLKMQEECLRGGMNKKQLRQAIENTPTGLNSLYDHNWTRIANLGEEARYRAFALLRWAAFSFRPLTVFEITDAVLILTSGDLIPDDFPDAIDDEYIKSEIIGLCSPLLEVTNRNTESTPGRRTVQLSHFSVHQYLLWKLPSLSWIYHENMLQISQEKIQNTLLAKACVQYLRLPQIWKKTPDDSLSIGVSLRDYAATTLHQHINSGLNDNKELMRLLVQFFNKENPVWNTWRAFIESKNRTNAEAETFPPSPLYYAMKMKLESLAKALVFEQNVNEPSSLGRTPLGIACAKGFNDLVALLLSKGADFCTAYKKQTPLFAASSNGHTRVVELLLNAGANETIGDENGRTPLYIASCNGYIGVVGLFLHREGDLTTQDNDGWTPLLVASDNGHAEVVKMLLEKGADFTTQDNNGWTPLHMASCNGHAEVVKMLLEKGADFTTENNYGSTPLHVASYNGHTEVVKMLLDKGANFMTQDNDGWTPLNAVLYNGHTEVVKMLLKKGTDFTTQDNNGSTPLHVASYNGHIEVVKMLLEMGADFMTQNNNGWTPLLVPSYNGHTEVVKMLLEKGADFTTQDNNGSTPLHVASYNGHTEVVKMLLDKGADFTTQNNDGRTPLNVVSNNNNGWTPLHIASYNGHAEVVKMLLEKDADFTTQSNDGWTPLNTASCNGHTEVIKILLEKGADFMTQNNNGSTPLHVASSRGHAEVVKMLLENGADFMTQNNNSSTPLNGASSGGHVEVVKMLLEKGADFTTQRTNGWTPLNAASYNGHTEVVKMLLEMGADFTTQDNNGWTPLNAASYNGHTEVVKMLLEMGADFTTQDNNGWTPLNAASCNGHAEVIKMLLEMGADFTTQDNDGWTPLNLASYNGHVDVVELLLRAPHFSNPEADTLGRTALFLASRSGQVDVVQYLLSLKRFDPDTKNYYGSTALSTAVANGHCKVVELLIAAGVNAQDQLHVGCSLLWWASHAGKPQMIKLLSHPMELGETFSQADKAITAFDTAAAWCDVCTLHVSSSSGFYSCVECYGFVLCSDCQERGFQCRDQAHALMVGLSKKS